MTRRKQAGQPVAPKPLPANPSPDDVEKSLAELRAFTEAMKQWEPEATKPLMGIEFKQLTEVLRTVRVDYLGQDLTVTFRANEFSPQKTRERARKRREEEAGKRFTEEEVAERSAELQALLMAQTIVSWDMLYDGAPMPITEEYMMMLPYSLLAHIIAAMSEDTNPKALTSRR